MQATEVRERLLAKPEATEDFPFGPEVAVFRIQGKMFALLGRDNSGTPRINLKCDPEESLILRELFPAVIPGYHMNKKHWNTLALDDSLPAQEIQRMIDNAWFLVFRGFNLEKSLGSQKSTQVLSAPGKTEKSLITNKVTTSFSVSPCTPITYASFSRPSDFPRLKCSEREGIEARTGQKLAYIPF